MISHVTIGVNDVGRARAFYDAVLGALGLVCTYADEDGLGYGNPDLEWSTKLWVMKPFDGKAAAPGNGWHVALVAPNHAAVDAFYQAALAHGGSDEGAPGLRPQYHDSYYAAYVRDPEGNKLQAVDHGGHFDVV